MEKIPKMIPQRCPVCTGYGTVGMVKPKECHGCKGRGYLWTPNGVYEDWIAKGGVDQWKK